MRYVAIIALVLTGLTGGAWAAQPTVEPLLYAPLPDMPTLSGSWPAPRPETVRIGETGSPTS